LKSEINIRKKLLVFEIKTPHLKNGFDVTLVN